MNERAENPTPVNVERQTRQQNVEKTSVSQPHRAGTERLRLSAPDQAASAYPARTAPDQEIVYRDIARHTYREMRDRIGQLASGLAKLGVKPGDTVAMMDWDSHRYLECSWRADDGRGAADREHQAPEQVPTRSTTRPAKVPG